MTTRQSILAISTALVAMWVLGACGGQAFTSDPDGGSGGSSSAGSGGSSVGGGGSGGSNVGGGGSGGSNVGGGGSGGSNVGGGGSGGSADCPPPSACNWCGGKKVYDKDGCIVGYKCANGVDPCWVSPCHDSSGCALDEVCGEDMLCWPAQEPKCGPMGCSSGGGSPGSFGTCSCDWSCNGKKFGFKCKTNDKGITSCECTAFGTGSTACAENHGDVVADAGIVDPCDDCCGFPKP